MEKDWVQALLYVLELVYLLFMFVTKAGKDISFSSAMSLDTTIPSLEKLRNKNAE
jgi:hypothetical protein